MREGSQARRWAAAAVAFLAVEALLIAFIDKPLSLYLRAVDAHDPALIDVFRAYTNYAKADWYLWPSGLGALACFGLIWSKTITEVARRRIAHLGRALGFFFAAVAAAGLTTDVLKALIGRARPVQLHDFGIYGFAPWNWTEARWHSMPSGEATTAFAVAAALTIFWPRAQAAFWLFAVAMATARVMVNAHYLSDVVAGAAVGMLTVLWIQKPFRRYGWSLGRSASGVRTPVGV